MKSMTSVLVLIGFYYLCLPQCQGLTWVNPAPDTKQIELCEHFALDDVIYTLEASGGTSVEYSVETEPFASYVKVDSSTGDITLQRLFDAEFSQRTFRDVKFKAVDSSDSSEIDITLFIAILDANDHTPRFENNIPIQVSIYEYPWDNATIISLISATDDDVETSASDLTFTLDDKTGAFKVSDDQQSIVVADATKLDYESEQIITPKLTVTDDGILQCGSNTPKTATTTVIINIIDGPDQEPFFTNAPYYYTMNERSANGTTILTVKAQDRDYSLDWEMKYSIVPDGTSEKWFEIDQTTGVVKVIGLVDRDTVDRGIFNFIVKAEEIVPAGYPSLDKSENNYPLSANASVTITILDINDNSPIFYELSDPTNIEKSYFNATIGENTPNAIAIPGLNIFVQDTDEGDNAEFSLKINDGLSANAFDLTPTDVTGSASVVIRVKNSTALDYEEIKQFEFEIIAQEYKNTSHSATATVRIDITDENDWVPQFESDNLQVNVSENEPIGTPITTITATDKDSGKNGEIRYSISPDDVFKINGETGEITLAEDIDREVNTEYRVSVRATDGGGSSSTVSLTIFVLDVNDEKPTFLRSVYYDTIGENTDSFAYPLVLSAVDNDQKGNSNSEMEFSIIAGNELGLFVLDRTESGEGKVEVKPKVAIDLDSLDSSIMRESSVSCDSGVVEIKLKVEVQDKGPNPNNGTTNVNIQIQDKNDNPPVFNQTHYDASVPEQSFFGTNITQVFATDEDLCRPNNEISYSINPESNVNALNAFQIDRQTGVLTIRDSTLDRDASDLYEFQVLAIDGGSNRETAAATVAVTITDVNNKVPVFNDTVEFSVDVSENASLNEVVWTAFAYDTDWDSDLRYTIDSVECLDDIGNEITSVTCTDPFVMNAEVGKLSLKDSLDRETIPRYTMIVSVEDINAPTDRPQITKRPLQVRILDENDNAPQFEQVQTSNLQIPENIAGTVIGSVRAVDPDAGANGEVIYSVTEESALYVRIDPNSGQLTSLESLDREEIGDTLDITIVATDKGSPPLSNETTVSVKIADANDQVPFFLQSEYKASVSESENSSYVVLTVAAADNDTGINAEIAYSISSGDPLRQFEINRTSGEISVSYDPPLDRETTSRYNLVVEAADQAGISGGNVAKASVVIDVTDVNDSPPAFDKEKYVVDIREDIAVGDTIYELNAEDADSDENGMVKYELVGGNEDGHFQINSDNGVVTLKTSIRNRNASYLIRVMAIDSGEPPLNSTCEVDITVIDVNLNDPQFDNLPTNDTVAVVENAPAGVTVFQVNASDKDRGENGKIFFSLTDGNREFEIGRDTGIIKTRTSFDQETTKSFTLTIKIEDNDVSGSPRTNTTTLKVTILDVNDEDPYYLQSENEQNITMLEESLPGPLSEPVEAAQDDDTEPNSVNYYYIVGGSGSDLFTLDKETRILSSIQPLDREATADYDLIIKASNDSEYINTNPPLDQDWNDVKDDTSLLHVTIYLDDINDNLPVFDFVGDDKQYVTDIPFDSQPNPDDTIIQVYAVDKDEEENAWVIYTISQTCWILNTKDCSLKDTFGIQPSREGNKGDVFVNKQIEGNQAGRYELDIVASDWEGNSTSAKLIIGIIKADETVVLYSRFTPTEFDAVKDQFIIDMEAILGAEVIIDSVTAHQGEVQFANSDIKFHAKKSGSTDLVPKTTIIAELNKQQNSDFLSDYQINGVQSTITEEPDNTQDYLTAGLIIACAIILVVILVFTVALLLMRRSYKRKLKVESATKIAAANMNGNNGSLKKMANLPNTNNFVESNNPLYMEDQKGTIDLDQWLRTQESRDDDDEIDDNAVDSARNSDVDPGETKYGEVNELPDQLLDDQFDIDFDTGHTADDNARLAAALNAANQRRGADNFTYLFDEGDGNTAL